MLSIIIVILSAKGQESEKTEGYQMGADLYETKPFSPKKLISNVKTLIDSVVGIFSRFSSVVKLGISMRL